MEGTKSAENALDGILSNSFDNDAQIESYCIVSKSGLLIAGPVSKLPTRKEIFSAMVSVMFSSTESTRSDENREKLDYVIGAFHSKRIFIVEMNPTLLLAVTTEMAAPMEGVIEKMKKVVEETKEKIAWLR